MQSRLGLQLRKRTLLLGVAIVLVLGVYALSPYAPTWSCLRARIHVALAQGDNCHTECTDWNRRPCAGFSACFNKSISCSADGFDQKGRPCQGCCFDCKEVCDPPPDQPPTISGTLNCELWGLGGWCIGSETLELHAEQTQGKQVLVSGEVAGTPFACTPANGLVNCSVPLPEGAGTTNFSAVSITGLTATGSIEWMRDSTSPQIDGTLNGTPGTNGWFISEVAVSASATDAISGIASLEYSLDGGTYLSYIDPIILTDGTHAIDFLATDMAGNQTGHTQPVNVDTLAPQIDMPGAWQLGRPTDFSVHDLQSGLSAIRVVIADERERFPKVVWKEIASGQSYRGEIDWDGRWKDGSLAIPGKYLAWVKASDLAGNEAQCYGSIRVPETSYEPVLVISAPTSTATFTPDPASLVVVASLTATEESEASEEAASDVIVTFSVAKESSAQSTGSSNNVFWGAAAVAMIGVFLAEVTRRKIEQAKKQEAKEAKKYSNYRAKIRAKKMEEVNAEGTLQHAKELLKQWNQEIFNFMKILRMEGLLNPQIPDSAITPSEGSTSPSDMSWKQQDYAQLEHAQELAEQGIGGGAQSLWDTITAFVQQKVIQPLSEKVYEPFVQPLVEKIQDAPITASIQNALTPRTFVSSLVTLALGASTIQWIDNVRSDPDIFLPAQAYAESVTASLQGQFPLTPEERSLEFMVTHPYEVVSTGSELFHAFTEIGTAYADAVWQKNPLVQLQTQVSETLEDSLCSSISSQSWSNRCTAAFYLPNSLASTPFDTTLGVVNSLVIDPFTGLAKQGTIALENLETIPDVITAFKEDGFSGAKEVIVDQAKKNLKIGLNDGQVQSAILLEILLAVGLVSLPLAGGIVLGTIGKGLIDLDVAVKTAKDKDSLIQLVTSPEVRTTVVTSILALALIAAGVGKKAAEFRVFQQNLSPSGQTNLYDLSLLEQTRLADLAGKMKLSPSTVEFYLDQIGNPGSPLAELSLADALKVSALAEQSGSSAFVMDYLIHNGFDSCLRNVNPDGLAFYIEQAKTPGSILSGLSAKEGVILSQLSPDSIAKVTGLSPPSIPGGVVPGVSTPVLGLTPQEINALAEISIQNPNADYAVIGLWRGGSGYTLLGYTEGYTYLSMPGAIYDTFFEIYSGDFRLVNMQYLAELSKQKKPVILETSISDLRTSDPDSSAFWEAQTLLSKPFDYTDNPGIGPGGLDVLLPP